MTEIIVTITCPVNFLYLSTKTLPLSDKSIMFLQDHTVPSSLSPTSGNRTGLAKAFHSLSAEGALMMTEMLSQELTRPMKARTELYTMMDRARSLEPQLTHPKMEETAKAQRAAAHGLAAALALGEDLNDDEEISNLDKLSGELVILLAARMADTLAIYPQPPMADLMGACADHLPTLGRGTVMRMWRDYRFAPKFYMR